MGTSSHREGTTFGMIRAMACAALAVTCVVLGRASATPMQQQTDKESIYSEMLALAVLMEPLKGTLGYEGLLAQYLALSEELGGDDPAGILGGGYGEPQENDGGIAGTTAPPPPPGCPVSTTTWTSADTPIAIPATAPPIVITSSIVVSGADPYLWDLDASAAPHFT